MNASSAFCFRLWESVSSDRVDGSEHECSGSALSHEDLGGEQDLHPRSRSRNGARWIRGSSGSPRTALFRVAKGFLLGFVIATPLGFILGLSKTFNRMFDPVIQVLRPISPLAWLPLGSDHLSEVGAGGTVHDRAVLHVADGAEHDGRRSQRFPRNIATLPRFCDCRGSRRSRRCCCRRHCPTCSRDIG